MSTRFEYIRFSTDPVTGFLFLFANCRLLQIVIVFQIYEMGDNRKKGVSDYGDYVPLTKKKQ